MDKIIDILSSVLPYWNIAVLVVIVLGFRFYYSRFKPLEDKTKKADCENKHNKLNELLSDMKEAKRDIENIRLDLVEIKTFLQTKHKQPFDTFGMKKSPRQLNPNGKALLERLQGMKFLNKHKEFFFAYIDKQTPKTAYDVEVAANSACLSSVNEELFISIKNFIYNAPMMEIINTISGEKEKYEIAMPDVCFVLSIPLRDMYLEAHPEIPTE